MGLVLVLIAARLVQGAGAAAMIPQIMSVIQQRFEGQARARALGAYAAVLATGAVAGQVLGGVLDHDLHAKRVDSLCDATLGVLRSASLAVCAIGQGLAAALGLNCKHATKQVDRLLSNTKINVDDILARVTGLVPQLVDDGEDIRGQPVDATELHCNGLLGPSG